LVFHIDGEVGAAYEATSTVLFIRDSSGDISRNGLAGGRPGNGHFPTEQLRLASLQAPPAGSYALSGFDTINFFSGTLNIRLPLLSVQGRGESGYTMILPLQNQRFELLKYPNTPDPGYVYYVDNTPWGAIEPNFSPGVFLGRQEFNKTCTTTSTTGVSSLIKFTFIEPDGTEYELHDTATDAQQLVYHCAETAQSSRGQTFVSADGTAMTYVSDVAVIDDSMDPMGSLTGTLYFRDGRKYRIVQGNVASITDRNGNQSTFTYDPNTNQLTTILDSWGRTISLVPGTGSVNIQIPRAGNTYVSIVVSSTPLDSSFVPNQGYAVESFDQLFPAVAQLNNSLANGATNPTLVDPTVIRSVTLPNGTQYVFSYNPYGEVERIDLPTGGSIRYTYEFGDNNGLIRGGQFNYMLYRRLKSKIVCADQTCASPDSTLTITSPTQTFPNTFTSSGPSSNFAPTVTITGSGGSVLLQQTHTFYGQPVDAVNTQPFIGSGWEEGKEIQTASFDTGGTLLRTVANTWQQGAHIAWYDSQYCINWHEPARNPQMIEALTTLDDGEESSEIYFYDQYNNRTDTYEYGFGAGTIGALVRHTNVTHMTDAANPNSAQYVSASLLSLPWQQTVSDGGGATRAQTIFAYDENTLSSCPNIVQLATGVPSTRGNQTSAQNWLSDPSTNSTGWLTSRRAYDIAGNVVAVLDPRGGQRNFTYVDSGTTIAGSPGNSCALQTSGTSYKGLNSSGNPLNTPSGTALASNATYDYYLGKPLSTTDINGNVTHYSFADSLSRLTQAIRPDGSQTNYQYTDTAGAVKVSSHSDLNAVADQVLYTEDDYDGLGRKTKTQAPSGSCVFTIYDGMARVQSVSNPGACGSGSQYTTTAYDGLGRTTSVTTPDAAVTNTYYRGPLALVVDPAGKTRQSSKDALGRLAQVIENQTSFQTSGGTISVGVSSEPVLTTNYSYDTLDNLASVSQNVVNGQAGQTRTFLYDSLKRLVRATNVENGTTTYTYDPAGNLLTKTSPAPNQTGSATVTTNYQYDALNRLTMKTYSDGTTRQAQYFYDNYYNEPGDYGMGRLSGTWDGANTGTNYRYDPMGRIRIKQDCAQPICNKVGMPLTQGAPICSMRAW
jgi:YD repeat-containing protein